MGAKNTIVLITALFTGMVLALQTGIALARFGAKPCVDGFFVAFERAEEPDNKKNSRDNKNARDDGVRSIHAGCLFARLCFAVSNVVALMCWSTLASLAQSNAQM